MSVFLVHVLKLNAMLGMHGKHIPEAEREKETQTLILNFFLLQC